VYTTGGLFLFSTCFFMPPYDSPLSTDDLDLLTAPDFSPEISLALLAERFGDGLVFSTSFGLEDQAVTHMLHANQLSVKVFTLDTGRLFPETHNVWSRTLERYELNIDVFAPNTTVLENLLTEKGPLSFYQSVSNRKECCHIRKVEPLQRALTGHKLWITGIRAEQSPNRQHMKALEWDETFGMFKYHPLFYWSQETLQTYIAQHNIPYNSLHDSGFVSIGCAPCTRAIQEGEDFRAGRWWWEDHTGKECGLHSPSDFNNKNVNTVAAL